MDTEYSRMDKHVKAAAMLRAATDYFDRHVIEEQGIDD